jgi:osmotically-inducible protein OsmY
MWMASCKWRCRAREREEITMKKTDSEIKQLVSDELKWDTQVKETDIGIEVKEGVVTLTGTVGSYGERQAAQRAAHRVAGVHDVANDIRVKLPGSPGHTDSEIARAVRHALEWDVFVLQNRITSTVSEGWVTLDGEVDVFSQREAAEKAISNLAGVVGVLNKIVVKTGVFAGDVRSAIEDALERRAVREASRLNIDVEKGRVRLSGSVPTYAEKKTILGAARGTPGVTVVDDMLRIE